MKQLIWILCLLLCLAYLIFYICYTVILWRRNQHRQRAACSIQMNESTRTFRPQGVLQSTVQMPVYTSCPVPENVNFQGAKAEDVCEEPIFVNHSEAVVLEAETTATLEPKEGSMDVASSSVIGTRSYQQDAVRTAVFNNDVNEQCVIGVLCDGMGGMEGGEYASNYAVDRMVKLAQDVISDYQTFFRKVLERINREVAELHDEHGKKISAGSTLTCAIVEKDKLYWCTVGDSRIYLYRDGQMKQLNVEHNYRNMVNEMIRTGQMRAEEVNENQNPEALTSYLGIDKLRYIDGNSEPIHLRAGDVILQCSDGLYRALSDQELAKILQQLPDLKMAAEAMTSMAVTIPGPHDNTSVVLIRYKGTA